MTEKIKKPYTKPTITKITQEEKEFMFEEEKNEIINKLVFFKFNKNIKLGSLRFQKNEVVQIEIEDAKLFEISKHGEIVEKGE